jgi:hypothetical protein
VPEYAGYVLANKLFSFRTPQAAQAERAAQAGEDPDEIAQEFAAASKAAREGGNNGGEWCRVWISQGSGFRVQGSGVRGEG